MQRDFATGHISRAALISALRLGVQSGSAVFFVFFLGGEVVLGSYGYFGGFVDWPGAASSCAIHNQEPMLKTTVCVPDR